MKIIWLKINNKRTTGEVFQNIKICQSLNIIQEYWWQQMTWLISYFEIFLCYFAYYLLHITNRSLQRPDMQCDFHLKTTHQHKCITFPQFYQANKSSKGFLESFLISKHIENRITYVILFKSIIRVQNFFWRVDISNLLIKLEEILYTTKFK